MVRPLFAVVALPGLMAGPPAYAAAVMKTEAGKVVHWEAPVLTVGRDSQRPSHKLVGSAVDEAIDEAMAAWNATPEMRFRFARPQEGKPPMVAVGFCSGTWKGPPKRLGQTEFEAHKASGLVQAAAIEINECDFKFVGPQDVAANHLDLQAVLTHELGHVLGLDHTADPGAVMHSCTGTIHNRRPNADDRQGVELIYGAKPGATAAEPSDIRSGSTKPVFLTGQNGLLGFELPWPELSNAHPVRFVPTVVPLPPGHAVASKAVKTPPPPAPQKPKVLRQPPVQEPRGTEMDWPAPATHLETRDLRPASKRPRVQTLRAR